MGALSNRHRNFLLRNLDRVKYRKFIINILAVTINRKSMMVHPATMEEVQKSEEPVVVELQSSLMSPVYPELKKHFSEEDAKKLNQLDRWTYENNLPHITENMDLLKLVLQLQNYLAFSDEEREKIDKNSMDLRGVTDMEYYLYQVENSLEKDLFEIIHLVDEKSGKPSIVELYADKDMLKNSKIRLCYLSDDINSRLMTEVDTLNITPADIVNVKESIDTTVGRVIFNQIMLIEPFGDKFPFFNGVVSIDNGDVVKDVNKAALAGEITIEQYKKFLDGMYYLGHFTEINTPCLSERSITTDANMNKRKAELYEQYKDSLGDPSTIAKIEDELIAMDKSYMKDDVSMRFYKPLGGKTFDLWRKKLYIAVGGIEAFDKDTSKYEFLRNSLEDGVCLEDLPKYGNESRKGSYQRGHETRNGGALTKYIIRAFHDIRIQEDDCGTNKGIKIDFGRHPVKSYIGRYILIDGKWTEITEENMGSIKPKEYLMRSPQYCGCTKNGYCFKCMGRVFSEMDMRQLAMGVVDISTTFMNAAMKNMHGSKLALHEVTSLDKYIL